MTHATQSAFSALWTIISAAVAGALVWAILQSLFPIPAGTELLFASTTLGSFIGFLKTVRR